MVSTKLQQQRSVTLAITLLLVLVQHAVAGELPRALFESRYPAALGPAARPWPRGRHYLSGAVRGSDHFVVWTGTHPRDVEWVLRVLETAWNDISVLSDHWTSGHCHPGPFDGPIPVMVGARLHRQRLFEATGLAIENGQPMIYVNAAINQPRLAVQAESVRASAAQSFLYVAGHDRWLPPWAHDGIVEYIGRNRGYQTENAPHEQIPGSASWIEFLLEGADSIYAPDLFESLRLISRDGASRLHNTPRLTRNIVGASRLGPVRNPETAIHTSLDALRQRRDIQASYLAWSRDRNDQLPDFRLDPRLPSKLQRRQREMVLILKLMQRFNEPDGDVAAYDRERSTFKLGAAADLALEDRDTSPDRDASPQSLQGLYDRLTDSDAPPWASRDTDGTLLLAQHKQRIDELFSMDDGRYQVVRRDGRTVLLNHWRSDMVLAGSLNENPDRPGRPIAKVEIQRAEIRGD